MHTFAYACKNPHYQFVPDCENCRNRESSTTEAHARRRADFEATGSWGPRSDEFSLFKFLWVWVLAVVVPVLLLAAVFGLDY